MARDEFFADVRRAVQFMAPRVEADSPFTDPEYIRKMLRVGDPLDHWLSSRVVQAFRPEDFVEDPRGAELADAVTRFRQVAAGVDPTGPVRWDQLDAAIPPFVVIVRTIQDLIREDWLAASNALLDEAEGWAKGQEWPTRRFSRQITEDFVGKYELDRLIYSAEGAQLALIPVGRFVPGTDGMLDLAVMPAYDSMNVIRRKRHWSIEPLPGVKGQEDWSKTAFIAKSLDLARLP